MAPRRGTARRLAGIGAALVLGAVLAPAPARAQQERPPLSAGRVTGEIAAGTYSGIGGFIVGRFVGERAGDVIGVSSEDTRKRLGYAGGVIGGGLATAGVVFAIGNIGDQTGEFDATYLGTGVGFVAALGLSRALLGPAGRPRSGMSTAARWAAANVIAALPAIGATIGFNSSRRYR